MPSLPNKIPCHVCGSLALELIRTYEAFHRVTSDCKPWKPGGHLAVCSACACAQAVLNQTWHDEAAQIYQEYTIYHQSQGVEQNVFDQNSGQATSRSSRLLQQLQRRIQLPERGRLLDIGCGNGALLRAFGQQVKGWSLAGVEVNDRYKKEVESITGVEALFTGSAMDVPGRFHLISLMHALEHIPSPRDYIRKLWDKLEVGGLLLIQVPDCEQNPFMFLVADHASHCFLSPLQEVVQSAGYAIEAAANDWVAKELTVVARKSTERLVSRSMIATDQIARKVESRIEWLRRFASESRNVASKNKTGIFGTSIAATWLFAELNGSVEFFVDEDPNRIGRTHLDRPIVSVNQIPPDSHLLLALPPFLAKSVAVRLTSPSVRVHLPAEIS